MAASDNKKILAALEANWQAEMEGFSTYTALSKDEANPHRRNALRGLAMAEKHHAELPRRHWNYPKTYDSELYKRRNHIEHCFNRLKHFRRFSTRYCRTIEAFRSTTALACA